MAESEALIAKPCRPRWTVLAVPDRKHLRCSALADRCKPSSFSDLSMWIARVEGSGDAPLFAGEYAFSKREKKTSREAVGASADDDAMTSIGCGGAYPKRPPRKPACEYEME